MIFLANDTSRVDHAGCRAVMSVLHKRYTPIGVHYWNERTVDEDAWENADTVIVNGEGTMHHNAGIWLLDLLLRAQKEGKRTQLVNSVWQEMPYHPALSGLERFTVREPLSFEAARKLYPRVELVLDASLSASIEGGKVLPGYEGKRVVGDSVLGPLTNDPGVILPINVSWADLVTTLRGASVYITGRFHGVCAAIRAGCPFETRPTNSWKIDGLLKLLEKNHDNY